MLKFSQKLSQIELSFVNLSLRLDGKGFLKNFHRYYFKTMLMCLFAVSLYYVKESCVMVLLK